jgi:hypothetical protein
MPLSSIPSRALLLLAAAASVTAACTEPAPPIPGAVVELTTEATASPLVQAVTVRMDQPAPADVTWGAPGTPVLRLVADSFALEHRFLLPRLRAGREYTVEAAVPRGTSEPRLATFTSGALPADIAEIDISVTGRPTVPVSLIEVAGAPTFQGLLVVEEGMVVGYQRITGALFGSTRRRNGNLVLLENGRGLIEVSHDGRVVHQLPQAGGETAVAYGRIHHDVTATPQNTLLFIANDTRTLDGTTVVGEALWEWNPETGSVLKRWSAFDHLDWNVLKGPRTEPGNWLHGNGISYGQRGNVLMSLRNVDQVISIAPDFSHVEWSLGGTNGTLSVADADRFHGQHYVTESEPDRVLVYDNGFVLGSGPSGLFTRAIEYYIDRDKRRANRVWQYRHSPDIYASLVGSARRLWNGNTTVLFGMLGGQTNSSGPITAVEVTPAGAVEWRLTVGPQLTRLYRLTPVASLLGEEPASFRTR